MSAEPGQRPSSCREFLEDLIGQTRPAAVPAGQPAAPPPADVWYLVYRDENDKPHTVKGSTDGIRNALRDNLLGDPSGVLVSRTKHGQFTPLASVPEFRDLVTPAGALPGARTPDPDETTDYNMPPPPAPTASGTRPRTPVPPSKPSTPLPPSGAHNQTAPYSYDSGARPVPPPRESREPREEAKPKGGYRGNRRRDEDKPFNWTPVLAVVVLILTAIIGYLVLAK